MRLAAIFIALASALVSFSASAESITDGQEEAAISRTVLWAQQSRSQFYFVFEKTDNGCFPHYGLLRLTRHGIIFEFFESAHPEISNPSETGDIGGPLLDGECLMFISVQKFVKQDDRWVERAAVAESSIVDWDERENRMRSYRVKDGLSAMPATSFLFDARDDEDCPKAGGGIMLYKNSLLSEYLNSREQNGPSELLPDRSTAYERAFLISRSDCYYRTAVSQFVIVDGNYVPVRTRYLGPDDRGLLSPSLR